MLLVNEREREHTCAREQGVAGAGSGRSLSPSTGEVEVGEIEVLGHPGHCWLHSKFEAETSYAETLSQRIKQTSKNQKDVFYEENRKKKNNPIFGQMWWNTVVASSFG